jgi:hypothetical protein
VARKRTDSGSDTAVAEAVDPEVIIEVLPIDQVHPDPRNRRKHNRRGLDALKAALERFGQVTPITIDRDNVIRKGNGTHQALVELGKGTVRCVRIDLDADEAAAYAIADNRTGELSDWDFEGLAEELKGFRDKGVSFEGLGWADFELEPLLEAEWRPPAVEDEPDPIPAPEPDPPSFGTAAPYDGPELGRAVVLTVEQREMIDAAVARVRESEGDPEIAEGRCLELICADYLAGA